MRAIVAMTQILVGALVLTTASLAFAQPGYPPQPMPRAANPGYGYGPPPPPAYAAAPDPFDRRGLTLGASMGVGTMDAECLDCQGNPLAGAFSMHIGAMVSPRLALVVDISGSFQQLDELATVTVGQYMAVLAGQYWVTPKLWIKGGIGASHVSLTYDDGFGPVDEPVADGGALMGAIGYEIVTGPRFAIDLQARMGVGTYEVASGSETLQSGIVGVGFSWF